MPKYRSIQIQVPLLGVDRRMSFQGQPPYSCPDALNVRPRDVYQDRQRLGSRPAMAHEYTTGVGLPIRLLNTVTYVRTDGLTDWTDHFRTSVMSSLWTAAEAGSGIPSLINGEFAAPASTAPTLAYNMVRSAFSNFSTTSEIVVEMYVRPQNGKHHGAYHLFLTMPGTNPTVGLGFRLYMNKDGTRTLSRHYANDPADPFWTQISTTSGDEAALPGWFRVRFNQTTRAVQVWWRDMVILSGTLGAPQVGAGQRVGMGVQGDLGDTDVLPLVDGFRVQYFEATPEHRLRTELVVASGNSTAATLQRESFRGFLDIVPGSVLVAGDRYVQSVERGQKLWIADWSNPRVVRTTGTVTAGILDDAAVASWTALGIRLNDDVVVITGHSDPTQDGTYAITVVHVTNGLTLSPAPANGTCSYRVERGPKVYDPAASTLTMWWSQDGPGPVIAYGQVPVGCPSIALYQDRIVLGGNLVAPHVGFFSRRGEERDWDFGDDPADVNRAIALQNSDAGEIGEPILAIIAFSDDYVVFGCRGSLWVMRGDPGYNGTLSCLSRDVGVASPSAWCRGPANEVLFLSSDGLYALPPGAAGMPAALSRERIPKELLEIDPRSVIAVMGYSTRARGAHIFVTPSEFVSQRHYWLDWDNKGFWFDRFARELDPTATTMHRVGLTEERVLLVGCWDGNIRSFREASEADEMPTSGGLVRINAITSYALLGPFRLGSSPYLSGMLAELLAVTALDVDAMSDSSLSDETGAVAWDILAGETIEEAYAASSSVSGRWGRGLSVTEYPRIFGNAAFLKLSNVAANRAWAVEELLARMRDAGPIRRMT